MRWLRRDLRREALLVWMRWVLTALSRALSTWLNCSSLGSRRMFLINPLRLFSIVLLCAVLFRSCNIFFLALLIIGMMRIIHNSNSKRKSQNWLEVSIIWSSRRGGGHWFWGLRGIGRGGSRLVWRGLNRPLARSGLRGGGRLGQ